MRTHGRQDRWRERERKKDNINTILSHGYTFYTERKREGEKKIISRQYYLMANGYNFIQKERT